MTVYPWQRPWYRLLDVVQTIWFVFARSLIGRFTIWWLTTLARAVWWFIRITARILWKFTIVCCIVGAAALFAALTLGVGGGVLSKMSNDANG